MLNFKFFLFRTSSPWSLPMNRAIAVHPNSNYSLLLDRQTNQITIVISSMAKNLIKILNLENLIELEENFHSTLISNLKLKHPLFDNVEVPVILSSTVSPNRGTGALHVAPGCCDDDYFLACEFNLPIECPLDSNNCFSSKNNDYSPAFILPYLEGKSPKEASNIILDSYLSKNSSLLFEESATHSVPHCARCHQHVYFRVIKQWFFVLSNGPSNIIKSGIQYLNNKVQFLPEKSAKSVISTLEKRPSEWCISRQRFWGVPIPALICSLCDKEYTCVEFIDQISKKVKQQGIEYWRNLKNAEALASDNIIPWNLTCPCGKMTHISQFQLETGIFDVWFDSGVSIYSLSQEKSSSFHPDLVIEGQDQHRGWFQSILICNQVLQSPYPKQLFTHGFVLGEGRTKLSKSENNGAAPIA